MHQLTCIFTLHARTNRDGSGLSFGRVFRAVTDLVDEREIAIFATVGWGLVPIARNAYELYANVTKRGIHPDEEAVAETLAEDEGRKKKSKLKRAYEDITPWDDEKLERLVHRAAVGDDAPKEVEQTSGKMTPFRKTMLFTVADHISQASKISLSVIVVDALSLISKLMGYNPMNIMERLSRFYSKFAYTGW